MIATVRLTASGSGPLQLIANRMFLLLIAAIAGIALVAAAVMITRTRARDRRDRLDRLARQNAAAQARAAAQAEAQRRRALDNEDDLLTSVLPAIRMPWQTQLSAPREPGYPDLDGGYPQFSALAPFQAAPVDAAPAEAPWPPAEAPRSPAEAPWAHAIPPAEPPAGRGRPGHWDDGQFGLPLRREPEDPDRYPAAPAAWDERPRPVPAPDGRMAPAAVPAEHAEHATMAERARRRSTHGSHRGGHARRRRG